MAAKDPFALPPEYQAPIDAAGLRAKLAQAMMQQYMRPVQGQMVGKHYVRTNPLQHLTNILGQYWQRQGIESAGQEVSATRTRAGAAQQSERDAIIQALRGREEPSLGADTGEAPSGPRIIPGDPQEAERLALGARFPGNQDLAKVLMEQRMKLFEGGAKGATNPSVVAAAQAGGDVSKLQGAWGGGITEQNIGGKPAAVTYDPKSNEPEVKFAPRDIKVSATASTGGKLYEAGGKFALEQIDKSLPNAQAARVSLTSIQEALGALDAGAQAGITQPVQQIVRKLASDFGINGAAPDANDRLAAVLKKRVIDRAGGLGRQISDADRKFLEAASGDVMTDPIALRRILALDAVNDIITLGKHNQLVQNAGRDPNLAPWVEPSFVNFQFSPGAQSAALVEGLMEGKDSFKVLPAAPTPGPRKLKEAVSEAVTGATDGLGPQELTSKEAARLEELRKRYGRGK